MKPKRLKLSFLNLLVVFLLIYTIWSPEVFCKSEKLVQPSKAIIVLVDMSGSTNQARKTLYQDAFAKIYQSLDHGDRLLVSTITDRSDINFKSTIDVEIPKKTLWDNRLQFERNLNQTRKKIQKEVKALLSNKHGSQWTEILNSLNIVDTIFHDEKDRQKILVILSDMIQDSKEYKFDKDRITDAYINAIIQHRQKEHLIPSLAGVKVYVAGANAASSDTFRAIQTFWTRYFSESGADFSPYRYGHSLISFENGS